MAKTFWSTLNDVDPNAHKTYNKHSGVMGKTFVTTLIRDGESVLDVACGSGILYEQMKKYVKDFTYVGVDITDEFVAACHELYPEQKFEVCDMRDLSMFGDNSFDVVVNYHAIECCGDYKKAIAEALRVAKKRVIIGLWKGLTHDENDLIKPMADGVTAETMISAKQWFAHLKELGYYYAPWVEMYTDEFRYNLMFVLDKEFKRVETMVSDDRLTQK